MVKNEVVASFLDAQPNGQASTSSQFAKNLGLKTVRTINKFLIVLS